MTSNIWSEVLERIRGRVNAHSFGTWLRPTKLESETAEAVTVRVPNPLFAEWLRNNYQSLVEKTIVEIDGRPRHVLFTTGAGTDLPAGVPRPQMPRGLNGSARPAPLRAATAPESPGGNGAGRPNGALNPRYLFETFVVGTANEFAHAAALRVAENPSKSYNPLYVYGGAGLGKTHLMQAIARRLLDDPHPLRLKYVTTEAFMTGLIQGIRHDKTMDFKRMYRSVDVLLIDDIQFLAGKERTQEEFFHTFNDLYESGKQIVMTSDCAPRDIRGLEERLRSRFQWGLMADIQPPDLETKVAILKKKAEAGGASLSSDVALYVASKVKSNVRELEGCLTRVLAHTEMTGKPLDVEAARQILQGIIPEVPAAVSVEAIQKQVADHYNLSVAQLKSRNNSPVVSQPRQVAMYLCKGLTGLSLPEIGRKFGGKHHTTVLYAIRRVESRRREQPEFDRIIHVLARTLR